MRFLRGIIMQALDVRYSVENLRIAAKIWQMTEMRKEKILKKRKNSSSDEFKSTLKLILGKFFLLPISFAEREVFQAEFECRFQLLFIEYKICVFIKNYKKSKIHGVKLNTYVHFKF